MEIYVKFVMVIDGVEGMKQEYRFIKLTQFGAVQ